MRPYKGSSEDLKNIFREKYAEQENKFFGFGNKQKKTNKYYTYKHVLSENEIIINTNNIQRVKDSMVLVTGKFSAVYLKEWQVKMAHNFDMGIGFYIVKLNRQYFKPYAFTKPFEDFCIEQEQDFDYLLQVARAQDQENMTVANGPF